MENRIQIIISFLSVIFLTNCNFLGVKKENNFQISIDRKPKENSTHISEYKFESDLDTIIFKKNDYRSTRLYMGVHKKDYSLQEMKKINLDTFVVLEEGTKSIPFKLKFNEAGDFYINGYFEDIVFLDNYCNNGKTRVITHEYNVGGEVTVYKSND